MKGTRPLDNSEIRAIVECFTGDYEKRIPHAHDLSLHPELHS